MAAGAVTGLGCPRCGGPTDVPEGQAVVTCPSCGLCSAVVGDRGVLRFQVRRGTDRAAALGELQRFFGGMNKASDLRSKAVVREAFLVYLPYWRARAEVVGWRFGTVRRRSGKHTRHVPVEVEVAEEMVWSDAACDVAEFGVQRVPLAAEALSPYDPEALRAEGMVFEPVESPSEAVEQAHEHFVAEARSRKRLSQTTFELFRFLREQLSLVFYPLWVLRYEHKERMYQAVIDGARPRLLYGKAPGNVAYRSAMLVGGLALGNLLLVDGSLLALAGASAADDGFWIVALPVVAGIGLVTGGYKLFRHGEEIVDRHPDTVAEPSRGPRSLTRLAGLTGDSEEDE